MIPVPTRANAPNAYILALLLDPYFFVHCIGAYSCSRRLFHSMAPFSRRVFYKCSIFSFDLLISHGLCIDHGEFGFVVHSCRLQ